MTFCPDLASVGWPDGVTLPQGQRVSVRIALPTFFEEKMAPTIGLVFLALGVVSFSLGFVYHPFFLISLISLTVSSFLQEDYPSGF